MAHRSQLPSAYSGLANSPESSLLSAERVLERRYNSPSALEATASSSRPRNGSSTASQRRPLTQASTSSFHTRFPLVASTLKPSTRQAYANALQRFLASITAGSLSAALRNEDGLDELLSDYIHALFYEDASPGNVQRAVNTLAALCHQKPSLRSTLGVSRAALKGWKSRLVPRPAAPLTRELLFAFIGALIETEELHAAVCLALSWAGYLRANEALGLTTQDIALPGDARLGDTRTPALGVLIRQAKTGPRQFVAVSDVTAQRLVYGHLQHLQAHRSPLPPTTNVFSITYAEYLRAIRNAAARLGIGGWRFTTHSSRIGGALYAYLQGTSVETIAVTGRWASLNSVRLYLRNGRSQLMDFTFSPNAQAQIQNAIAEAERFVVSSPRCPNI